MTLPQLLLQSAKTLKRLLILTNLDQQLWDQLQSRASQQGLPLRELVRQALQDSLKNNPHPPPITPP